MTTSPTATSNQHPYAKFERRLPPKVSKGPGRLRLLRLPPGQAALLQFAEHVTLARQELIRLKLAKDAFCVRMHARHARSYGETARAYYELYRVEMEEAA